MWHDKKYLGLMCLVKTEKFITLMCYGLIQKGTGCFLPVPYKTHREKSVEVKLERTRLVRNGEGNVLRFPGGSGKMIWRHNRNKLFRKCVLLFDVGWKGRKLSSLVYGSIIKYFLKPLTVRSPSLLLFHKLYVLNICNFVYVKWLIQSTAWCAKCTATTWAVPFIRRHTFFSYSQQV